MLMRALLDRARACASWLKTSGGKGLHVVVPLAPQLDWDTVKGFSQAVVQHLARTIPQRFVAKSGAAQPRRQDLRRLPAQRLRRHHGGGAFSARARPGLGVSMPVRWDELDALKGGAHWTVRHGPSRGWTKATSRGTTTRRAERAWPRP